MLSKVSNAKAALECLECASGACQRLGCAVNDGRAGHGWKSMESKGGRIGKETIGSHSCTTYKGFAEPGSACNQTNSVLGAGVQGILKCMAHTYKRVHTCTHALGHACPCAITHTQGSARMISLSEEASFGSYIDAVSRSAVLIGRHLPSMANSMFMRPGSMVWLKKVEHSSKEALERA
eukprot:1156931-Pelagomonas_calceolata.AAC.14